MFQLGHVALANQNNTMLFCKKVNKELCPQLLLPKKQTKTKKQVQLWEWKISLTWYWWVWFSNILKSRQCTLSEDRQDWPWLCTKFNFVSMVAEIFMNFPIRFTNSHKYSIYFTETFLALKFQLKYKRKWNMNFVVDFSLLLISAVWWWRIRRWQRHWSRRGGRRGGQHRSCRSCSWKYSRSSRSTPQSLLLLPQGPCCTWIGWDWFPQILDFIA